MSRCKDGFVLVDKKYETMLKMKDLIYVYKIAKKLRQKYKLNYNDMIPIQFEDDKWIKCKITSTRKERRSTDDGKEHYIHKNGKHYVLDYHFHDDEWFEYEQLVILIKKSFITQLIENMKLYIKKLY